MARNGHPVGRRGFLLFANARKDRDSFDGRLDFDMQLVEIAVDADWIEPTLTAVKACLMADEPPAAAANCENCGYVDAVNETVSGTATEAGTAETT